MGSMLGGLGRSRNAFLGRQRDAIAGLSQGAPIFVVATQLGSPVSLVAHPANFGLTNCFASVVALDPNSITFGPDSVV